MTEQKAKVKLSGYDKYVNWKLFAFPLGLLILLLLIPTPQSMMDVGVEYSMGPKYVQEHFAKELFNKSTLELAQWEIQMVRMMEQSVQSSSFSQAAFLRRNQRWCEQNGIPSTPVHLEQVQAFAKQIPPE